MLKVFLTVVLLSTVRGTSLRRRRSVINDGGHVETECVGNLRLVTNAKTETFSTSMSRVLVRDIARVVVEGSCCGVIYSGVNYRGRSHSINRPGEFLTRVRHVKSVVLRRC
eukprot:GFUD01060119.1.p2 GENE.GFUD01060119.1~~GFUD01060119.1.p2  ORF type:complete len:111 (+),score=29.57 GFUD01060119.1:72-404(+)